jgi:hypothetical protein
MDEMGVEVEESMKVVEALHKILRPFLFRCVKSDVGKNLPLSVSFSFLLLSLGQELILGLCVV